MSTSSDKLGSSPSPWKQETLFCYNLPSTPRPDLGKILVTGASGYVGGRLVPELLARGYSVRVMVRRASPEYEEIWPGAEIAVADAQNPDELIKAFEDIHTAYYLIHSLLLGPREFAAADIQAAVNFREAATEMSLKRIIYLGGLGDVRSRLSNHLRSRMEVAGELSKGQTPVTILRAAIIIGSGSASYEIIEYMTKKLPVIPIPKWAKKRCQPIAIRDVIKYLVGVLEIPETAGCSFDIGGRNVLSYEIMLKILARLINKKRLFLPFPISIRFYAYFASFLTPVPASITRSLVVGLKDEVICLDNRIREYLPFKPLTYREAVLRAMTREEQDNIHTRWSDSYPRAHELAPRLHELKEPPRYISSYSIFSGKAAASLFGSACKVGGKTGWFNTNWMWKLRGGLDRVVLGVGHSRGRRSQRTLKINDALDFWRIEDIQKDRRLLLRAEMKMPGKAWLEFTIREEENSRTLTVTAYYSTQSLFGKIYWYMFLPFHHFIFRDLIRQIEKRS